MSQASNNMSSFCKESNNIDGTFNFQAWKNRIDLVLIENDVMDHVLGKFVELDKRNTIDWNKYFKHETRIKESLLKK